MREEKRQGQRKEEKGCGGREEEKREDALVPDSPGSQTLLNLGDTAQPWIS